MGLQRGALGDALMHPSDEAEANDEAKANKAAGYDNRLVRLEADVSVIKSDVAEIKGSLKSMDVRLSHLESSDVFILWMAGLLSPLNHYNPAEDDKPLMLRKTPL